MLSFSTLNTSTLPMNAFQRLFPHKSGLGASLGHKLCTSWIGAVRAGSSTLNILKILINLMPFSTKIYESVRSQQMETAISSLLRRHELLTHTQRPCLICYFYFPRTYFCPLSCAPIVEASS